MLHHQHQYLPRAFQEMSRSARDAGVIVEAIHLKPDLHQPFDPDPSAIADCWRNFELAIEGAGETGARTIVWKGPLRDEYPVELGIGPMLEVVADLDERCLRAGIRLALENAATVLLSTIRDFIEIGPRLPARVGFAFDPHHAARSGANPMLLLRHMQ